MNQSIVAARPLSTLLAIAILISAAASLTATPAVGAAPSASAPSKPIDLNKATETELMTIPGIGKVMAQRIVTFRTEHGPFERVDDLLKIKGIGEKSLQKMTPHVTVGRSKR